MKAMKKPCMVFLSMMLFLTMSFNMPLKSDFVVLANSESVAVKLSLNRITSTNDAISHVKSEDYLTELIVDDVENETLPEMIEVYMNGEKIETSSYFYDVASGQVHIAGENITGDIEIIASATPITKLASVTQDDIVYGGILQPTILFMDETMHSNDVVFMYKLQTQEDEAYTTTIPTEVGDYVVQASLHSSFVIDNFTILPIQEAKVQTPTLKNTSEEDQLEVSGFSFDINTQTIVSYDISRMGNDVFIPKSLTYNEVVYDVLAIGDDVFAGMQLNSLSFASDSVVERIGSKAFYNNPEMSDLEKTGELILPDSVEYIDAQAFERTGYSKVTLDITTMGQRAFANSSKLKEATVVGAITTLPSYAFLSAKLDKLTVGENIQQFHASPFTYAKIIDASSHTYNSIIGLQKVEDINSSTSLYSYVLWNDTVITDEYVYQPSGEIVVKYLGSAESVTVPDRIQSMPVTTLGSHTFYENGTLKNITISNDIITMIDSYAVWHNTSNLSAITISNNANLTQINSRAFYNQNPISIDLSNNIALLSIGDSAFAVNDTYNSSTVSLNFIGCAGLQTIGNSAFYNLDKINILDLTPLTSLQSIGESAFANREQYATSSDNQGYRSIDLSGLSNLTTINNSAFSKHTELASVDFSGCTALTSIGNTVFYNAYKMQELDLTPLTSLQTIGSSAFAIYTYDSSSVLHTIDMSNLENLTTIGSSAFSGQRRLADVVLVGTSNLQSVQSNAFAYNTSLIEIDFSDSLDSIQLANTIFSNCTALQHVYLKQAESNSISGYNTYWGATSEPIVYWKDLYYDANGFVFDKNEGAIIDYIGEETSVNIPVMMDGVNVVKLGPSALRYTKNKMREVSFAIESVVVELGDGVLAASEVSTLVLPNSVTTIGKEAFANSKLASITLPESLTSMGIQAFYNCDSLVKVDIPEGVTTLESQMFAGSAILEEVKIPASVTSISTDAFLNTPKLKIIDITTKDPDSITGKPWGGNTAAILWNDSIYDRETGLIYSITNNSVTGYVGDSATVVVPAGVTYTNAEGETLQLDITEIDYRAFYLRNHVTSITLPDTITRIDDQAFYNTTGLKSINIPDTVEYIGIESFYQTGLLDIVIPAATTTLGDSAFYYAGSLVSVRFAANSQLLRIGTSAFYQCRKLKEVYFEEGSLLESIGDNAFYFTTNLKTINLEDLDHLKTIGSYAFRASFNPSSVDDRVMIPKSVTMMNNAFYESRINYVEFEEGITLPSLSNTFYGSHIIEVEIPKSVQNLNGAFRSARVLSSVSFEEGTMISKIGEYAFFDTAISEIIIPETVGNISSQAFYSCDELTALIIPKSVTRIEYRAFSSTTKLNSVTFAQDSALTAIGNESFKNTALTSFIMPNSVSSMGIQALANNPQLETIRVSSSLTALPSYAFAYNPKLKNLIFNVDSTGNNSLTRIDDKFILGSGVETLIIPAQNLQSIHSSGFAYNANGHYLQSGVVVFDTTRTTFEAFSAEQPWGGDNDTTVAYVAGNIKFENEVITKITDSRGYDVQIDAYTDDTKISDIFFPGGAHQAVPGEKRVEEITFAITENGTYPLILVGEDKSAALHYVTISNIDTPVISATNVEMKRSTFNSMIALEDKTAVIAALKASAVNEDGETREVFISDEEYELIKNSTEDVIDVTLQSSSLSGDITVSKVATITIVEDDAQISISVPQRVVTYGESTNIIVTPSIIEVPFIRSLVPNRNMISAYYTDEDGVEHEISVAQNAIMGQPTTLVYDTTSKILPIGESTITVKYGGGLLVNPISETTTITVSPKQVNAVVEEGALSTRKITDGTNTFTNVDLEIDATQVITGDAIDATVNGSVTLMESNEVGSFPFLADLDSLVNVGAQAQYYEIMEVSGAVHIDSKLTPIVNFGVSGSDKEVTYGDHIPIVASIQVPSSPYAYVPAQATLLKKDGTLIEGDVSIVDEEVQFTYDSATQVLPIGRNELTLRVHATDHTNQVEGLLTVTVLPKEITLIVSDNTEKDYDASTLFTNVTLEFEHATDILVDDVVSTKLVSGHSRDSLVGSKAFSVSTLLSDILQGEDASWYVVSEVRGQVEILEIEDNLVDDDEDKNGDLPGDAIKDMYQTIVHHTVVNGTWDGETKLSVSEVVTFKKRAEPSNDMDAEATYTTPTSSGNIGYDNGSWSNPIPTEILVYTDKEITFTYTYVANNYEIVFNANTGTGTMLDQEMVYDEPEDLSQNIFEKPNHVFVGWSTTSTGEVAYTDEENVVNLTTEDGGTVTLYAVWEEDVLVDEDRDLDPTTPGDGIPDIYQTTVNHVVVNGTWEGETETTVSEVVTFVDDENQPSQTGRATYDVEIPNPNTGYANGKWTDDLVPSGTLAYTPDEVTFTHTYTPSTYNVIFDANTGTGTMPNQEMEYDSPEDLSINIFEKPNHIFMGWSTTSTGEVEYTDEQNVVNLTTEDGGTVTLYAVWEEDVLVDEDRDPDPTTPGDGIPDIYQTTVNHVVVNGTWEGETETTVSEVVTFVDEENQPSQTGTATYDVEIPNPNTGYANGKWTDDLVPSGTLAYTTDEVTFTHTYTPSTYNVIFDANTGTGTMPNQEMEYDSPEDLSINIFEKPNHIFMGWSTTSTGEVEYTDEQNVVNLTTEDGGTVTLYAVWEEDVLVDEDRDLDPTTPGDGIPDKYQIKVIYKIENGKWIIRSNANIEEVITFKDEVGNYSNTAEASASLAKAPLGGTPNVGYGNGAWDEVPPLTLAYTDQNKVFTYTHKLLRITITYPSVGEKVEGELPEGSFIVDYGTTITVDNRDGKEPNIYPAQENHAIPTPSKEGYTFEGYEYDSKTNTLTSKWSNTVYNVYFEENGGSIVSDQMVAYQDLVTIPIAPVKAGYVLEGWYIDRELKIEYDFNTPMPANTITLYAKYKKTAVAPSTGDTTNSMVWIGLMFTAMCMVLTLRRRIK